MEQKDIIEDVLYTKKFANFMGELERIRKCDGVDYMDAVISYCESEQVEPEAVAKLIKSNAKLKAIIREEAENLNFLSKTAKLPI